MVTVLPPEATQITPQDRATLRYAVRTNSDSGFIFLNNYQDHVTMADHQNISFTLELPEETLTLPQGDGFTLKSGVSAIIPFNLDLGGVKLKYATAQLVTRIYAEEIHSYFFFVPEGFTAEYCLENAGFEKITVNQGEFQNQSGLTMVTVKAGMECIIDLTATNGNRVRICTLTQAEILNFWKVSLWGTDRVIFTSASLIVKNNTLQLFQTGEPQVDLLMYPGPGKDLQTSYGPASGNLAGLYTHYVIALPPKELKYEIKQVNAQKAILKIDSDSFRGVHELLLQIDYAGDVGHAFINGRLVHDHFCNGQKWEIGLKRFYPEVAEKGMYFYISPLRQGKTISLDSAMAVQQEFKGELIAKIHSMEILPEYSVSIQRVDG
jgi:hypothetical protein